MPYYTRTRRPTRFPGQALAAMQRDPLGTFERMRATGGALVETWMGLPFFLVAEPDLIGEQFAWAEAVLVTATLAQHWQLRRADATPVPLYPSVTLRPGRPVPVMARRRGVD